MYPKIEDINKNVVNWIEQNYVKTLLPFHVNRETFKFLRINRIGRVWKENDYWIVDVFIDYSIEDEEETGSLTFQVNDKAEIHGFNLHQQLISSVEL